MELSRAGALHPLQTRTFDNPINFSSTGVWTTRKSGAHGGSELAMALRSDGNIVDGYRWDDGGGGAVSVAASVTFQCEVTALAAADVNGDGSEDLVAGTSDGTSGPVGVALARSASSFDPAVETNIGTVLQIAVGNFKGDGIRDVAATGFAADGSGVAS